MKIQFDAKLMSVLVYWGFLNLVALSRGNPPAIGLAAMGALVSILFYGNSKVRTPLRLIALSAAVAILPLLTQAPREF